MVSASSITAWSCTASPSTASAEPTRRRAAGRIAALLLLLLACVGPHLVARLIGRSPWPRRFLGAAARICGARAHVVGKALQPHCLILANHTSWLDILVLAGATGTRFVSKTEVRSHWLLGWLADQNDTLYIERQDRRGVLDQADKVARALNDQRPLALFPEGTTGDGRTLLPFRSALLAAVTPLPAGCSVRPVAIDYGAMRTAMGWTHGESGTTNALRLLGRRGGFPVMVRLLDELPASANRKALAQETQAAIASALAASNANAADL